MRTHTSSRSLLFGTALLTLLFLVACSPKTSQKPATSTKTSAASTASSAASTEASDTELLTPEALSAVGHPVNVIRSTGFLPRTRTIPVGQGVIFLNQDDVSHAVKFLPNGPQSADIPPDKWAKHEFKTAGTFRYTDPDNPSHTGVIIVK